MTQPHVSESYDLFASAQADRKAEVKRLIERSVPVAQRLAALAKLRGITAEDLWHALKGDGIITGAEQGRSLSWMGRVFPSAELKATRERRYNKRNRNDERVWVMLEYWRA